MSVIGRTLPPPRTIPQMIDRHLLRHPAEGALYGRAGRSWRAYSWAVAAALIRRTALGLYALGVRPGARVALCAEASPEWLITDLAVASIGAASVPIYAAQTGPQIISILKHADARICLISGGALARRFGPIAEEAGLEDVILMAPASAGSRFRVQEEVRARGDELAAAQPALFDLLRARVTEETPASIIYTLTAAGEARAEVLTHAGLLASAREAGAALGRWRKNARALSCLPLSNCFERTMVLMCLERGVPVYFSNALERLHEDLKEVRPAFFTAVPMIVEKIYHTFCAEDRRLAGMKKYWSGCALAFARSFDPESKSALSARLRRALFRRTVFRAWRAALGGKLRFMLSIGSPLSPHLARIFCTAGIPVLQGYGLAHGLPVVALNRPDANRIGSVGKALGTVEIRIEHDGEICVRRRDPSPGAQEEPWVHTGDLGHVDSDGYLFVTGRRKNLIRKSPDKPAMPGSGSSAFRMYHQP